MKHIRQLLMGLAGVALIAQAISISSTAAQTEQQNSASATSITVPRLIRFSGILLDEQGHALKGPVGVTFELYAQQSGGATLWMETQNVAPDANGDYSVLLGAETANGVPMELFASGEARWLSVQAERQPEQPRVLLVSVPYALKAGDAQTLGGLPANAFALAGTPSGSASSSSSTTNIVTAAQPAVAAATIGGTGTTDFIPLWTGSTTLGNSLLFQAPSNSIGIGTTAPAAKLDVNGGATIRGQLSLPFTGTATSTLAFNSQPFDLLASTFNSSTHAAVPQNFRWQAEPLGNNTASPSGKLNLLFASGTATPAETGLSIASNGLITFAPGQTMPAVTGNETVNGNFTASGSISGATAAFSGNNTSEIANITQLSAAGNGLVATVKGGFGLDANATSPGAVGIAGNASATTGLGVGVIGSTESPSGTGVLGTAPNGGVGVKGVSSVVGSSVGVAGEFNSTNGAVILRGLNGSTTEFNVTGRGDVFANGNVVANGAVSANGGFSGSSLSLGGIAILGGPLGVGTTFPHAALDVHDFPSAALIDTLIGNAGCGTSFAGIGFLPGTTGFGPCTNYSLLGDGANTFVNAGPFGSIHFRHANADAMIVNNLGEVGIGTTTPQVALDVVSTGDAIHGTSAAVSSAGVSGLNSAAGGIGVFGSATNGFGMETDSNVTQALGMGGWVKAMIRFNPHQSPSILACYNSQATGAAVSTPPCGFTVNPNGDDGVGHHTIGFGFTVDNRFISATVAMSSVDSHPAGISAFVDNCIPIDRGFCVPITSSQVGVITFYTNQSSGCLGCINDITFTDEAFFLFVY